MKKKSVFSSKMNSVSIDIYKACNMCYKKYNRKMDISSYYYK